MLSVLITGSYAESGASQQEFEETCERIGEWLHAEHRLVVAATLEHNADHHALAGVLKGFEGRSSSKKAQLCVELFSAENDDSQTAERNEMLSRLLDLEQEGVAGIAVHRNSGDTDWAVAWQKAVNAADLVIVVGGREKPQQIYSMALNSGKPVLGLSKFGGIGAKVMTELRQVYRLVGIDDDQTYVLNNILNGKTQRQAFIDLLAMVVNKNPWAARNRAAVALGATALLFLTVLWVALLIMAMGAVQPPFGKPYLWIGPLCIVAGAIGGMGKSIRTRHPANHDAWSSVLEDGHAGLKDGFTASVLITLIVVSVVYGGSSLAVVFLVASAIAVAVGTLGLQSSHTLAKVVEKLPHH